MVKYYLTPIDGRKSFYGKAVVKIDGTCKRLYSYDTLVCEIEGERVTLHDKWDYSATTLRHVKAFLIQNGFVADSKADIAKRYA